MCCYTLTCGTFICYVRYFGCMRVCVCACYYLRIYMQCRLAAVSETKMALLWRQVLCFKLSQTQTKLLFILYLNWTCFNATGIVSYACYCTNLVEALVLFAQCSLGQIHDALRRISLLLYLLYCFLMLCRRRCCC